MTGLWRAIIAAYIREFRRVIGDSDIMLVVLAAPIVYALFYGGVYWHKGEHEAPIVIVDRDQSELSRTLIRFLDASEMIVVTDVTADFDEARGYIYNLNDEGIVYIPDTFQKSIKTGQNGELMVYLNTSRFLVSNDLYKAINEIGITVGVSVKIRYLQSRGLDYDQAMAVAEPISTEVRSLFNPGGYYGDFLLPGLLLLILQQTMLIGLAESIARERESNSLKQWLIDTRGNIFSAITGKSLFYIILYIVYAIFFYAVIARLFHITLTGNAFMMLLLLIPFLAAIVMMGILISSLFNKKIQALQFLALTSIPIFLLSGYSWPLQSMPVVIRWLAYIVPTTPFLNAFTRVALMNAGLVDVNGALVHIIILVVVYYLLAARRLRKLADINNQTV
jgi:ABC-2 type transport system permease protein